MSNRTNIFKDRRLGEKDNFMDEEDRKLARYAATRVNKVSSITKKCKEVFE